MRAHIIENGVVVNTIEVESLDFLPNLVEATEGSIGWQYIDGQFIAPEPAPEPVPEAVTSRQARQWLIQNGTMPSQVDAMIAATEDLTERELLHNYWEYSTEYQRNHPLLESLGEGLGMTPEQLDQAFREAAQL